jgi:hypothetical protein
MRKGRSCEAANIYHRKHCKLVQFKHKYGQYLRINIQAHLPAIHSKHFSAQYRGKSNRKDLPRYQQTRFLSRIKNNKKPHICEKG